MSFTEKRLCNPTQLTTSGQTLYTVPSSKTAIVKQIVVTNVTASAATFSLFIGSAATPNALFSATSVAANDAIVINLSQVLNSTEILTALASANSTLNITISGVENDGPLNPLSTYIADNAITTAKLADSSVTATKFASNVVIPPSLVDAKGDLIVGTADNTVGRLAVGSNNQGLVADSAVTSGVKWIDVFQRQSGASSGEASTINISPRPWNLPWGLIVSGDFTSGSSVTSYFTTTNMPTVTFTAVASRRYKVTWFEPEIVANGYNYLELRQTNATGTLLARAWFDVSGEGTSSTITAGPLTFSAGSVTLVTVLNTSGNGFCTRGASEVARLMVEDIGPA